MDTAGRPSFATLLRAHRLAHGLSQEGLAEQTGLSRDAISRLERGERRRPRRDTVALLARALKLSGDERARLLAAATPTRGANSATSGARRPLQTSALPQRLTSFVGREREIAEVQSLLLARRLLTLTGPGGIGKTSLALAVAEGVQAQFPNGVALAELAALTEGELVPHAVASALSVRERPGEPLLATLGTALGASRRLLVLDNCEHLVDACARLAEALLRACPNLTILATSREPLRIGAEVIWRVPALALPDGADQPLAETAQSEAVRLFVERAAAVRPGFALTAENAPAVGEICRRLGGIPLAIELAAARVGALAPAQIARHLDERFRLLTTGSRTALPRQQTLRATLDWSYELLTEQEQVLFRRLAVFVGGWTEEAAEAVAGGGGADGPDVLAGIGSLADKGLVEATERAGEARFALLETIRAYAWERLGESGEEGATRARHAAYVLAYAEEFSAFEHSVRQSEWLAQLDVERDNLRRAVDWWMSRDLECALRLVSALGYGWWRQGQQTELRRWIARLLPLRQTFPRTATLARFLRQAGECTDLADLATRHGLFEESVAVSRDAGDRRGAADALWCLARNTFLMGDYTAARALYVECLADADAEVRTRALVDLATIARRTGDVAQARILSEDAVASARHTGVPMDIGFALDFLGKLERMQGSLARAVALSEASLAVYREAGLENVVHWMSRALGRLARLQGDYARARILQGQALDGARKVLDRPLEVMALDELGLIAAAEGDLAGARRHLEEALAIARDGMRWVTAELIASLGLVARAEGGLAEARQVFDEALTFWREVGNPHGEAVVKGHLGVVALQEGNLALARDLLSQSLTVRHALGDQGGIATLLECFAGLSSLGDDPARAFQLLGAADRIRSTIGNPAPPIWQKQRDPWMEPARLALDDRARLQAYVAGQTTGWEGINPDALHAAQRI
jgi:predicted ATPase/DNA-binding XRE family transcriptional regulator